MCIYIVQWWTFGEGEGDAITLPKCQLEQRSSVIIQLEISNAFTETISSVPKVGKSDANVTLKTHCRDLFSARLSKECFGDSYLSFTDLFCRLGNTYCTVAKH